MRVNKNRYEHPLAGDLVHIDVKKVGRIPDGGGWRVHGKGSAEHKASQRRGRIGYRYFHTAIDDHSRLAYTEALGNEKAATAAGFWQRAKEFFAAHGIEVIRRVLTDNGSCYRAKVFNDALGDGI
jgi:transposase InsO family protein